MGASPLPNLAIPATLHASLIARLDRLGPVAKEVAQIGVVIGREFSYELIQPVAQRTVRDLEIALDRLTNAGLLFCRGVPPHSSYLFKHALVQDAAYRMTGFRLGLPRSRCERRLRPAHSQPAHESLFNRRLWSLPPAVCACLFNRVPVLPETRVCVLFLTANMS